MKIDYTYIFIILSFLLVFMTGAIFLVFTIKKDELIQKKKIFHIEKFDQYMILLEFNMKKAYEIIHKDRIMIYSLEATTPSEVEYTEAIKDFINLTLKFLGINLKDELIEFYGTEDSLLFNIAEYFNTNYENDEVRKGMTDKLMGDESESPGELSDIDLMTN